MIGWADTILAYSEVYAEKQRKLKASRERHRLSYHRRKEPKLECHQCGCTKIICLGPEMAGSEYKCTKCKQQWVQEA